MLYRGESKVREAKCEKFRDEKNINEQDEKYLSLLHLQHNALKHILRRLSLVELIRGQVASYKIAERLLDLLSELNH